MHKIDDQNVNFDVFLRNGDLAFILFSLCLYVRVSLWNDWPTKVLLLQINRKSSILFFCCCFSFQFVIPFCLNKKKMNISSIFRFVWNYTTLRMLSHQKQICDIILLFIVGSFICLVGYSLDFFQFVNDLFLCFLFCVFHNHVYIHVFINSPFCFFQFVFSFYII